jgi:segregation and condensation protein B
MQEEKTKAQMEQEPLKALNLDTQAKAAGPEKPTIDEDGLKKIIEALIFASDKPLAIKQIKDIIGDTDTRLIRKLVNDLKQEFTRDQRSFNISEVAGGFQFSTDPAYARWLKKLYKIKQSDYLTGPSLETIAIIAYRQPVTKADIEFIRGVAVDGVINNLLQKGFIKVVGKKDVIGRPYLYGTTALFLQYFGLNSIEYLPALSDFREADLEFNKPQETDNIVLESEQALADTGGKEDEKDKDITG